MATSRPSRRRLLLPALALSSVLLTTTFIVDLTTTTTLQSQCDMTWSWPVYSPVTWRSSGPLLHHRKYRLYRVQMKLAREPLAGVPVLFVPGHVGSYKQARSLSRHLWDMNEELFDVFALEFKEEPTGLNGNFVADQASFLNDAVRAILQEYRTRRKTKKIEGEQGLKRGRPESVVVVAHSMGGIVARTAELLPNYKRRSIQHVVALGVPYEKPSFPFDAEMNAVYDRMHAMKKRDDEVVYVSIAGGHKDTLVQTSWTSVDTVADPSRAFAVLASAIPTVGTPVDHFCLLWCHQLMKVVAQSLYEVVDLETRKLLSSPSARLAIAKKVLFGKGNAEQGVEIETNVNVSSHRTYVQNGYYPGEYTGYALLLPPFLAKLLRTKLMTVFVIMYVLALQIFCAQVSQWQSRFDLQSMSSSDEPRRENFPSFTSMLHPAAHAPAFLKNVVTYFSSKAFTIGSRKVATAVIAVLTLTVTAWALYVYYGGQDEQATNSLIASMTTVAEFAILYAYALGLLYAVTTLFSLLHGFVVSPVMSTLSNVAARLKVRTWMIVVVVHAIAQLLGHFTDTLSWNSSRVLALLILSSFIVFVMYTLALSGGDCGTSDQQRMQRSLFAVLWLSIFSWVGKVAYFAEVARLPPLELSNSLLMESGVYVVILSMYTYIIHLSLNSMIPLPPTAFFGASSGQDAASIYGMSSSSPASSVKITAENCPKCVFEDGGPGAVFVKYSDKTTHRIAAGGPGGAVFVGPTFRVVSCDCMYRFKTSRDFCDFCVRSCRLCGGGNGNFQEAAKYKAFLEESKVDVAMHAIVPMTFQICAAVQVIYGLDRAHMSFYLAPMCALALVTYHVLLRHPIEARRTKNKQRKKATKKGKSPSVSKHKPTTAATDVPSASSAATSNETAPRKKKKSGRKSRTSFTSVASPPKEKDSTSS
uniref:GPI inositol-deacylase n=1 Tax=Peronospora matthiolae TaxID=2874970 RepID=A0AAV1VD46_9STRA